MKNRIYGEKMASTANHLRFVWQINGMACLMVWNMCAHKETTKKLESLHQKSSNAMRGFVFNKA